MNRMKMVRSERNGSAVILVVLAVVILAAMGAGLLGLGLNSRIFSIRTAQGMEARCAADAGLTKAIYGMNGRLKSKSWADASPPYVVNEALPNCSATFSYKASMQGKNTCMVRSVGNSGPAEKGVYAVLRLKGLFEDSVLLADEHFLLSAETVLRCPQ